VDYRKSEFDSLLFALLLSTFNPKSSHFHARHLRRCVITQRYDHPMIITTAMHVTGLTKEARLQISINFISRLRITQNTLSSKYAKERISAFMNASAIEMPDLKSRLRVYTDSLIASWTQTRRPRLRRSDPSKRTDRATAGRVRLTPGGAAPGSHRTGSRHESPIIATSVISNWRIAISSTRGRR